MTTVNEIINLAEDKVVTFTTKQENSGQILQYQATKRHTMQFGDAYHKVYQDGIVFQFAARQPLQNCQVSFTIEEYVNHVVQTLTPDETSVDMLYKFTEIT